MSFLRRAWVSRRARGLQLYWLTSDIAVSREPSPAEWPAVSAAGVRCVVDLRAEQEDNSGLVNAQGLRYLRVPIVEGAAPTDQQLSLVTDWIVERISIEGPVLVHCREGRGRSPLVACAALVKLGIPPYNAYQLLKRAQPGVALSRDQETMLQRFGRAQE